MIPHLLDGGTLAMAVLAAGLVGLVALRHPDRLGAMLALMREQAAAIWIPVPVALLAAAYISDLIPTRAISALLGAESGARGIALACLLGGLVPGGPMVSFPLALVIWQTGAGVPQMVAFLSAWSIFAVHRIVAFELPIMGPRFVAVRLASSWMLPPLAGVLAGLLVAAAGR